MYPPQVSGFPGHAPHSQPSYPPQNNPGYPTQTPAFTQNQYSPSSTNYKCYSGQIPYPSHQNYPSIPNSTMPQHGGYSSSGCIPISTTALSFSDVPAVKKSKVCLFWLFKERDCLCTVNWKGKMKGSIVLCLIHKQK